MGNGLRKKRKVNIQVEKDANGATSSTTNTEETANQHQDSGMYDTAKQKESAETREITKKKTVKQNLNTEEAANQNQDSGTYDTAKQKESAKTRETTEKKKLRVKKM